ncbi:MAG TPA: hypothetical protein VEO95_10055 [Chthoniobacteraceae bacterium]|nr:hypothetical protein [Chthoniobacteraceae bacterium]
MKALRSLVLFVLFVAAFGAVVWWGLHRRDHDEKDAKDEKEKHEPGVVKIDVETQKRLGLAIAPLKPAQHKPAVAANGRVIDPSPLVALDGDLATATAALDASKAAEERARGLFQTGENVARKTFETAQAQLVTDQTHVQALRRKLALEWGDAFAELDNGARGKLIDELVRGALALVRVDVPAGQAIGESPKAARVAVIGREGEPLDAAQITPATLVDPKTQTQGYLLRVEHPPFALHPGAAVTAWLELPGEAQAGVVVPRSAIVYFGGAAWIYVQREEDEFERRKIALDQPVAEGVFVAGQFKGDEKTAVTGAQLLLAEEQKSAGGSED